MAPCVLHIDIDAFFASVEQIRNPVLRGKPVAVGAGVVASASYEARRFGLRAGMPLRQARALCPDLRILDGHAAIYRSFGERIFTLCGEYAPSVETYLDEAYCDWNGMERLYPDPVAVAAAIQRRAGEEIGLSITAGLGKNRMLAKMASKSAKPHGLRRVPPGEEDGFIRSLPVRHLPGVGPRTEEVLAKLNVQTIGDLRLFSRPSLQGMFGLCGAILYDRSRGEDTQPVCQREVPRSIRRETSFHQDTIDRRTIDGTLYYLTERAANTLRQLRLKARQLGVKIRYHDFVEESATRKLSAPTQLDSELYATALKILESLYTRRVALRLIGVLLTGLVTDDGLRQLDLFEAAGASPAPGAAAERPEVHTARVLAARRRERKLLESLDTIRERYGYSSVVCGRSLHLLGSLEQDDHGFILRTPSLTR